MEGPRHAQMGLGVGFAAAPLFGVHTLIGALPLAVCMAGYSLANDLDCHHSTATTALGPVSRGLSWFLRGLSCLVHRLTATPADRRTRGTHRALTHTIAFAGVAGWLAHWTSAMSPWATLGWLAFGAITAAAAMGGAWVLAAFVVSMLLPLVLTGGSFLAILLAAQPWVWISVSVGCLAHIVGDAITVDGCPMFWPIPLGKRGHRQSWRMIHLLPIGIRLHTGSTIETRYVQAALFIGIGLAAWPLIAPAFGLA
jgi:hypothetical protein